MKKIYLTLGLAAGMALTSCSDFLDKTPSTSLPVDEAVTTVFDLENAVNGIGYLMSQDRMTYSAEFAIYADLRGSDFAIIYSFGQSAPIAQYTLDKNHELPRVAYEMYYKALANVNQALAAVENGKITNAADNEAKVNDLRGQLLAWRGLLHFDLARMFCAIPTTVSDKNAANSGLVLSNQVFPIDYKGSRSTLEETYKQITDDLTAALDYIGKKKNNGYLNYWSALALRARANLYWGKDAAALKDAEDVIAGATGYSLYTKDKYAEVWGQAYTSESLFELSITDNYNAQRNSCGYYCTADGYPECGFNQSGELFTYLTAHPEDVRSQLIKDQTASSYGSEAGYYPAKYPGRDGSIYVNNPKIIRLSEVYLIAAEAALKTGDAAKAAGYVNTLCKNRIDGYEDVASVTIDDVLWQYRVELFAENQYTFCYWRNKKSVRADQASGEKDINYDDYRTILPIPQREIDYNSAIVQNPGY